MAWASRGFSSALLVPAGLLASGAHAEAGAREPAPSQQAASQQAASQQAASQQGAQRQGAPQGGTAAAADAEQGWLRWQGPVECQNTREVERQLESLLGYAPPLEQLPPTRVEVGWGSARGWSLLIRVSLAHGERRREVVVRTCADGFDVVALTLALILDPELGMGEELEMDAPLEPESPPDASELQPAPPASSAVPAPVTAEPLSAAEELSDLGPTPAPLAGGRPALRLAGGGRADLGTLPATLFGGGLSVSLSAWHWRLDVGGAYLMRGAQALPLAVNQVSYDNALGLIRGCSELSPPNGGHFDLCLGGQLGSLAVSELGGERRSGRGPWAAITVGAELGLELGGRWGAYSGLELVFPLARHELGLASGAVVYEVPAVSVQLTLGGVFRVTEWGSP